MIILLIQTKLTNLETGIPPDWMVIINISLVYCIHLASTYTYLDSCFQ